MATIEFSLSGLTAGKTYVVTNNYTLTKTLELPDNVTLIFEGGMISSSTWGLIGLNTKIVAPITQIFGSDLKLSGTWRLDMSYPQWFGYTPEPDILQTENNESEWNNPNAPCAASAIEKAAGMLGAGGTVRFVNGIYILKRTCHIPHGISLLGNSGQNTQGSVIQASSGTVNYTESTLLAINLTDNLKNWRHQYPEQRTGKMEFLLFRSTNKENNFRAIKTGGCYRFSNIAVHNFGQAITRTDEYTDGYYIDNCTFYTKPGYKLGTGTEAKAVYYLDMVNTGDALSISNTAIHGGDQGLRINNCNGGKIDNCIINSDICIERCTGFSINNLHMEYGKIIQLLYSNVSIKDSSMWVGENPVIDIRGWRFATGNVILENVMFVYQENEEYFRTKRSLYDIKVDKLSSVSIRRCGRTPSVAERYYTGIQILKGEQEGGKDVPFSEWNNLSYLLSVNSEILLNYKLNYSTSINFSTGNNLKLAPAEPFWLKWQGGEGKTYIGVQFIIDIPRMLGTQIHCLGKIERYKKDEIENPLKFTCYTIEDNYTTPCIVRVFEYHEPTRTLRYADVHCCSSHIIYSNGLYTMGTKLQNYQGVDSDTIIGHLMNGGNYNPFGVDKGVSHFRIDSGIFTVYMNSIPTPASGTWSDNDIVYPKTLPYNCVQAVKVNGSWRELKYQ